MHTPDLLLLVAVVAGAAASAYWKKLTPAAALAGVVIAECIFIGDGYRGLAELALFFLLGTAATSWKRTEKLAIKGNAAHRSTRHAGQVIANGGVAAILGILAFLYPLHRELYSLMLAASLASATGDTLSSELGMIYGRNHINILTGKQDERGADGVISIEGTCIGIAGSALIAATWSALKGPASPAEPPAFAIITLAGTAGNLADSLLGALFERKGLLGNNTVNFLNTLAAALMAYALALLTSYPS
jgi:uncharacterized protein (TIGR00297 family)